MFAAVGVQYVIMFASLGVVTHLAANDLLLFCIRATNTQALMLCFIRIYQMLIISIFKIHLLCRFFNPYYLLRNRYEEDEVFDLTELTGYWWSQRCWRHQSHRAVMEGRDRIETV